MATQGSHVHLLLLPFLLLLLCLSCGPSFVLGQALPPGGNNTDQNPLGIGYGLQRDFFTDTDLTTFACTDFGNVDLSYDGNQAITCDLGGTTLPSYSFSLRAWGTLIPTLTGVYTFQTLSDDGIRLWINNQLVIDDWTDHSLTTDVTPGTVSLTAGSWNAIQLEFYQDGGASQISLQWSTDGQNFEVVPTNVLYPDGRGLQRQFYEGENFDNYMCTDYGPVNVAWTGNADNPIWCYTNNVVFPSTDFSMRANGTLYIPVTGTYFFKTISDDGVRVWINNQLVIDDWTDHPATPDNSGPLQLTGGTKVPIRVDYYQDQGGAVIRLKWNINGGQWETINTPYYYTNGTVADTASNWISFASSSDSGSSGSSSGMMAGFVVIGVVVGVALLVVVIVVVVKKVSAVYKRESVVWV